jgi:hypothetical protein
MDIVTELAELGRGRRRLVVQRKQVSEEMTLASLPTAGVVVLAVVVGLVCFAAGWVLSDARARGLAWRKAIPWALLQSIEFPLFFWLYRRNRPRRIKGQSS